MVKCPYCQAIFVENTLFCSECGSYLLQNEGKKTDPLDTSELTLAHEHTERLDSDAEISEVPRPQSLHLTIGETRRVLEISLGKTINLGRVDPTASVFPEVDVSVEGESAKSVSRRHARILKQGNEVIVEDLASVNGTFINGKRLDPYLPESLKDGDTLYLGKVLIEVRILSR